MRLPTFYRHLFPTTCRRCILQNIVSVVLPTHGRLCRLDYTPRYVGKFVQRVVAITSFKPSPEAFPDGHLCHLAFRSCLKELNRGDTRYSENMLISYRTSRHEACGIVFNRFKPSSCFIYLFILPAAPHHIVCLVIQQKAHNELSLLVGGVAAALPCLVSALYVPLWCFPDATSCPAYLLASSNGRAPKRTQGERRGS